jgi:transcriptional regulator with XRE-family HTH domain
MPATAPKSGRSPIADPHRLGCARKLIEQADSNGWPRAVLAQAIQEHCGHSLLRSYRLAHGWTLEEVVERVGRHVQTTAGNACGLNASRVSKWERGEEEPGRRYLVPLCRVFDTDPITLGLVDGVTVPAEPEPAAPPPVVQAPTLLTSRADTEEETAVNLNRRSVIRGLALGIGAAMPPTVAEAVSGLRRQLDVTLSATTISDSTVDHWESVADGYGRAYRTSPPVAFLVNVAQDIAELRMLADQRLPTAQRRGLCHATARMAGLLATTLINLCDHREARGWFNSAQLAADESEDPALRAWVHVRHAVSALYWDDPQCALDQATQAARIARHAPCVAGAWAPAVQARAYARLGRAEPARAALGRAEDAFPVLESQPREQHAYGYTAAQLHFYRSNTLTEIGDTTDAYQAQATALGHYGPDAYLDPTLVRLDRAFCLVQDGEVDEASRFASRVLTELPAEHRSPIVIDRARQLTTAIPAARRNMPAVREFHEVLALGTVTP